MLNHSLKGFFLLFITLFTIYIFFIKTEKYTSESIVMLKDLSQDQSVSMLGSLLGENSNVTQDSKLIELYIQSFEMLSKLDKIHHLKEYYKSEDIDFIARLSKDSLFYFKKDSNENFKKNYLDDLSILYDEPSTSLIISFSHSNPEIAQKVVLDIVYFATQTLNRIEKENTEVALSSLLKQEKANAKIFKNSIRKLIAYQNKHHTIDPNFDVTTKSSIMATLEAELIQKEVEYQTKKSYLSPFVSEMKLLKETIERTKKKILSIRGQIAGDGKTQLNKDVSEFEILKSEVDFNKERYKQTLIKLEETKVTVTQNVKNLITVTKPSLPTEYSKPNKSREVITALLLFGLMYGILVLVIGILNEHKD